MGPLVAAQHILDEWQHGGCAIEQAELGQAQFPGLQAPTEPLHIRHTWGLEQEARGLMEGKCHMPR